MQNRSAPPDTAYRYAKGLPVVHPYHKARIKIGTPLDFLVVSDHGEFMGVIPKILQGDPLVANTETGKRYKQMAEEGRESEVFVELIGMVNKVIPTNPDLDNDAINKTVWAEIMDAGERHYEPGKFTSFLGWEWSSTPGGANLHRVVFIREDKSTGEKFIPYTSLTSDRPEDLWGWLDKTALETGASFIAIPHNSNISQGLMFNDVDSNGNPITAQYARTRMRWEPVAEVTQIKGDSETHPDLSPNDEFADYETYEHIIAMEGVEHKGADTGDYARTALMRGLEIEERAGGNPYKFGMIGSTDSHTAMASAEEDNFWGKMALDSTPATKSAEIIPGAFGWDMGAAGLAAVWAEENTRESIFDAFQRKEVYATTGPRIQVRFFGGWNFGSRDARSKKVAEAGYSKGVPMGADLTNGPEGKAPSFLVHAAKDPVEGNLDRIQVVKGWLNAEGNAEEKVYDAAWSGDRKQDVDGKLPAVGNTVNVETGTYTNDIGAAQLSVVWTDPDFNADQRAFYYVRVLQIPTPRHTLFDALALGISVEETGHPATIQERAYTSPIWYTP